MKRLPLLVPLGERESPSDFLSRLAIRNCRGDMRRLAMDYDVDVQAVIDGQEQALHDLAVLGAADLQVLRREAYARTDRSIAYLYKGHRFSRTIHLSKDHVRMCPECMREDLDRWDFRVEARPFRRSHWILNQIRTCERHSTSLVSIGGMEKAAKSQDTSLVVARSIPRLDDMRRRSLARSPSQLEQYVLGRLDGSAAASWLGSLPLHVVMQTSALLGCSVVHGVKAKLSDLDEDTRWHADATGFEAISQGASGIQACLDGMLSAASKTYGLAGPTALFGQFYNWLSNANADPDFDPIRKIVTDYIIDTRPVGPGDMLFGKSVQIRKIHSVQSAAVETGIAPARMRSILVEGGWIRPSPEFSPNWLTFDALQAKRFLDNVKASMTWQDSLAYINAPYSHQDILLKSGFIKIWMKAGASGLKNHAFLPRDLDIFLSKLLSRADERYSSDPDFYDISGAQRRVVCGAEAIVRLILEDKLARVGKRIGVHGYKAVLVDPKEVESAIDRPPAAGLTLKEVAAALAIKDTIVSALIAKGHLPFVTERGLKTGNRRMVIKQADFDIFTAKYVSIGTIGRKHGLPPMAVKVDLARAGFLSAFPAPINLYRRSDINNLTMVDGRLKLAEKKATSPARKRPKC